MSACILDTSVVVDLTRDRTSATDAVGHFAESFLPAIVWGELMSGACKMLNRAAEVTRLKQRFREDQIVGIDHETALIYGELLADLERSGRRIPTNDIWIAATAVQFDLPLLARDGHFGRLPQLRWVAY